MQDTVAVHEAEALPSDGVALARRLRRRLRRAALTAHGLGAVVVALILIGFFFEREEVRELLHVDLGLLATATYLVAAGTLAWAWDARRSRGLWDWLAGEREPGPRERDLALRQPLRTTLPGACVWAGAALVLGVVEWIEHSAHRGFDVALTVVLGGLTTSAIMFLLAERALRPALVRALTASPPEAPLTPGVAARLMAVWGLATGVPVLGLVMLGVVALTLGEYDRGELAAATVALGAVALTAGLVGTWLVAGSLGHSLAGVRQALGRVRGGEFEARVRIDDGSEVGLVQAGFNEMAAGLAERERMRDLFGRHVGEEVARAALGSGATLGGEVRDVAALFVDIEGSTALAASRPPEEVVRLLNRFFAVVVDAVEAQGGWVDKFEGDAALCVFGAPVAQPDFADNALAAARTMRERLRDDVPELAAGIGVSAGPAVAGNVGAERRFEYTVIGDPVNEAARLCELAKDREGGVVASERLVRRAGREEASRWSLVDSEVLRGRPEATRLAVPATAAAPRSRS